MKLNTGDLINEVAQVVFTKKQAQEAAGCILTSIRESLVKRDAVQIAGFGSFKMAQRSARKGRHPQTGAEINIPSRSVAKFVPGKALKEAVK